MKKISKEEIERQLTELTTYGIFIKNKHGVKVSTIYSSSWKNALKEISKKKPKNIQTVDDANVSAHLKALWICGFFKEAKSEKEIREAVVLIDSFRCS